MFHLLHCVEGVGEAADVVEVVPVVRVEPRVLLAAHLEQDHQRAHVLDGDGYLEVR